MNKKILSVVIISLGALSLLSYLFLAGNNKSTPHIATSDYKNTSYLIDGQIVRLTSGVYESNEASGSTSKMITSIFGNEKIGDINGDKKDDIVFLLVRHGSGSGTFYYVAAALQNSDGSYTGTNTLILGDRIAPQTTEINNGLITVNYADRKTGEAMTSKPSLGKSMLINFTSGVLTQQK